MREVFVLVHIVLDLRLSAPSLFGCSALPSKVSRLVAVVTLPDVGWLARLGVFFKLGHVSSDLALALSCPSLIQWCVSPRQVHRDRDIIQASGGIR